MAVATHFANANAVVTTGWTNPTNAYADDTSYATAVPAKNATVNSDYGFANFTTGEIPSGAQINSVTMSCRVFNSAATANKTHGIQGRDNAVNSGTEAVQASALTSEVTLTTTLVGVTEADLRSASTLLKARVRSTQGNSSTTSTSSLDWVSIDVTWSIPSQTITNAFLDASAAVYAPTVAIVVIPAQPLGLPLLNAIPDYASTVMADGPGGYWRLGEASGLPQDISGNGNHVYTMMGTPVYGVAGALADADTAVALDSSQALAIATSPSLNFGDVFTVEGWVNGHTAGEGSIFCRQRNGYALHVYADGTLAMTHWFGGAAAAVSTALVPSSGWHHCVGTKNGADIHLYIDGVDVTGATNNVTYGDSGWDAAIGADDWYYDHYAGSLDEVAVYPYALSPAQVAAHFAAAAGGSIFAPGFAQVATVPRITLPLLDAAAAVYAPTVIQGAAPQPVTLGLLDAVAALYAPVLAAGTILGQAVWTTPGDNVTTLPFPTFAFTMPALSGKPAHFEMQIDDDVAFGSPFVFQSHVNQAGWEYWNGAAWTPVPQAGVPSTFAGNEARYTLQSALGLGVYSRRVRAGAF